jgi:hypothetical protein
MAHIQSPKEESSSRSAGQDPTEETIARMVEGTQKFLNPQRGNMTPKEEKAKAVITISTATQEHSELQIRTLRDAPRDLNKLRELLQKKQKQYERAIDSELIEPLVTEIDMLKFVLFLVKRNSS